MTRKERLLVDIAKSIMEVPVVTPETLLNPWDSMAWIIMQAAIDEAYGQQVDPRALRDCVTVADVLKLVGEA